jgi:hypothetical protein
MSDAPILIFPTFQQYREERRRARLLKLLGGAALCLGLAIITAAWMMGV